MNAPAANPIARAIQGAAGAPLDAQQKGKICALAREAWERQGRPGFAGQPEDIPDEMKLSPSEAYKLWRQNEQGLAVGHEHLTACQQRHFPELMRHFSVLAGRQSNAAYWGQRGLTDPARQARAKLERTFGEVSDVIDNPGAYAAKICRARYRCEIPDANSNQVWTLVFDLRRNAQRRRAKDVGAPRLSFVTPDIRQEGERRCEAT
jgi:hypothetical protein